jgi:agmatinase
VTSNKQQPTFLGLPQSDPSNANFIILPLPYEGTVSYGFGTSRGPQAVLAASQQVELWDDELDFELDSLRFHTAESVAASVGEAPESYLARVEEVASDLSGSNAIVMGVGGEHSLTPPLVRSAVGSEDLRNLTVIQIDAHTDLRSEYEGSIHSHACAMRRLTEAGASLYSIGIRASCTEEVQYAASVSGIQVFRAQDLANSPTGLPRLLDQLRAVTGDVYVTIDVDGLSTSLCPGTGTPEPGGLDWYPTLQILRSVLQESSSRLVGLDIVETVPMPATQVNEFTTARLAVKAVAYASQDGR